MIAAASTSAARATLPLEYRALRVDDLPRARGAFAEGHKNAPGVASMKWHYYKRFIVPELGRVLEHPLTEILAAYHGIELCGWLAFARGQRVDTVHWVSVPFYYPIPSTACTGCLDPKHHTSDCPLSPPNRTVLRRRGIMTELFDVAGLRERIAYTHRGALHQHRNDGKAMDERLLPWLASRGHKAAYVPWEQWAR